MEMRKWVLTVCLFLLVAGVVITGYPHDVLADIGQVTVR
jgi:hypothetical protein